MRSAVWFSLRVWEKGNPFIFSTFFCDASTGSARSFPHRPESSSRHCHAKSRNNRRSMRHSKTSAIFIWTSSGSLVLTFSTAAVLARFLARSGALVGCIGGGTGGAGYVSTPAPFLYVRWVFALVCQRFERSCVQLTKRRCAEAERHVRRVLSKRFSRMRSACKISTMRWRPSLSS